MDQFASQEEMEDFLRKCEFDLSTFEKNSPKKSKDLYKELCEKEATLHYIGGLVKREAYTEKSRAYAKKRRFVYEEVLRILPNGAVVLKHQSNSKGKKKIIASATETRIKGQHPKATVQQCYAEEWGITNFSRVTISYLADAGPLPDLGLDEIACMIGENYEEYESTAYWGIISCTHFGWSIVDFEEQPWTEEYVWREDHDGTRILIRCREAVPPLYHDERIDSKLSVLLDELHKKESRALPR